MVKNNKELLKEIFNLMMNDDDELFFFFDRFINTEDLDSFRRTENLEEFAKEHFSASFFLSLLKRMYEYGWEKAMKKYPYPEYDEDDEEVVEKQFEYRDKKCKEWLNLDTEIEKEWCKLGVLNTFYLLSDNEIADLVREVEKWHRERSDKGE